MVGCSLKGRHWLDFQDNGGVRKFTCAVEIFWWNKYGKQWWKNHHIIHKLDDFLDHRNRHNVILYSHTKSNGVHLDPGKNFICRQVSCLWEKIRMIVWCSHKKKLNVKLGFIWKDIFRTSELLRPFFAFLRHHLGHCTISANSAVTCGLTECRLCAEGEVHAVMRAMSYKSWL